MISSSSGARASSSSSSQQQGYYFSSSVQFNKWTTATAEDAFFLVQCAGQRVSRRKYATIRPFINRDVVHMDKRRSSSIVWSIYLRCEQEDATAEVGGGDGTPQVQDRVVACVAMATIMK